MIILRPAQLSDLSQIERLAEASGPMVCTLPAQRAHLLAKVERSIASLEQDVFTPGEEIYFFVLEELQTGQLLGTAAIHAQAGYQEPFYAYRNDTLVHSSRALKVHNRVHALTLTHALSDHSQLCSFYIVPALRQSLYPALLTLGRLLFVTIHRERFSQDLMAVLPGIADADGHCPFWEHVGRKFFGIDYNQAEYYNGTRDKTFIAELMPHHPLYVPLLDEMAQAAIGQVHPDAALQFDLLVNDGFEADQFVEIFDAGPIVTARLNTLFSFQNHQMASVQVADTSPKDQAFIVMSDQTLTMRAMITTGVEQNHQLLVNQDVLDALHLTINDNVHYLKLPDH